MIHSLSVNLDNAYIRALEDVFDQSPSDIEWLVISHDDPRVLDALSSALAGVTAVVLEVSQDAWDFSGSELPEFIEWAMQQAHISNVLLVGASTLVKSANRGVQLRRTPSTDANAESSSGYDRLIAGMQQANARSRDIQARFAKQMQQLTQIPVVHDRWSQHELSLYGLLYRGESGSFLAYDIERETFRPLL